MATGYGDMTSMRDSAMDWVGSWAGRVYDAEHALEKARERLSEEMDNNRRLHKELAAAEERVQTYENGIRWANLRGELAKANRERDEAEAKLTTESERWNSVYLQEALQAQKERDEAVARAEKAEDKLAAGSKRWDNFIAMAPIGEYRQQTIRAEKERDVAHGLFRKVCIERDKLKKEIAILKVEPEDERTPGRVRRGDRFDRRDHVEYPEQGTWLLRNNPDRRKRSGNRRFPAGERRDGGPLESKGRAARKDAS